MKHQYRCVAATPAGFVQQLAVSYIGRGYWFYVAGTIPERKDPAATDRKILGRYGIAISKWARARRKRAGLANVHYLRHDRYFVICATKGEHRFFDEEADVKDIRRDSIAFGGYSIGYKRDARNDYHPSVRIHPDRYRELKAYLMEIAIRRSAEAITKEIKLMDFEPYAPVRAQLLCILRSTNDVRRQAGLEPVLQSSLKLRRAPTVVFGSSN
jgi:hypothetical protein